MFLTIFQCLDESSTASVLDATMVLESNFSTANAGQGTEARGPPAMRYDAQRAGCARGDVLCVNEPTSPPPCGGTLTLVCGGVTTRAQPVSHKMRDAPLLALLLAAAVVAQVPVPPDYCDPGETLRGAHHAGRHLRGSQHQRPPRRTPTQRTSASTPRRVSWRLLAHANAELREHRIHCTVARNARSRAAPTRLWLLAVFLR